MLTRKNLPPRPLAIVLVLAILVATLVVLQPVSPTLGREDEAAAKAKATGDSSGGAKEQKPVEARPLAVVQASGQHEWTSEDLRVPEAIEKIAHGPEEFIRMVEENDRIERRQLVYRKEPAWQTVEHSKAKGEAIRKLTLPGLDGREVEVEVTGADLAFSGLSGTFTGKVAGREKSLVTLAFQQGREAFTVVSPDDDLFLQGHPREPGEIILTSFDPETYLKVPGGEPFKFSK
jgi:hypothetical protein